MAMRMPRSTPPASPMLAESPRISFRKELFLETRSTGSFCAGLRVLLTSSGSLVCSDNLARASLVLLMEKSVLTTPRSPLADGPVESWTAR